MKEKKKSVFLRNRKYVYVGGSLLPKSIHVSLDATGDSRWLRIGLVPGWGRFTNTRRFFSLASGLWIKAPESRTAAVVVGSVLDSHYEQESDERRSELQEKVVRWGLMSTANINKKIIPQLRNAPGSRLEAVASRDLERARDYAKAWRIPKAFGSYEALLESEAIDVVYVSLPNNLHAEWAIKAMRAGKHVLCEKPLAGSVEEVEAIEAVSRETDRVVTEAFMYRHHRRTKEVKRLLDSGIIGEIRHIRGAFTFELNKPGNIRLDVEAGGGSLWDVGCYPVSFARYLMGIDPEKVSGFQRLGPTGVDLHFNGQLQFPSGVSAQIESGFDSPLRMEMTVFGTKGTIDLPDAYKPGKKSTIVIRRDGEAEERRTINGDALYRGQIDDLAECIHSGRPPLIPLSESRGNMRTLVGLYRSARTGKVVTPGDAH